MRDETGTVYYWNAKTGASQWHAPTSWAEEVDPSSGVSYYTDGMKSTWRRPAGFLPVLKSRSGQQNADWTAKTRAARRPAR
ncbi:hypothetical protein M885DRAFT_521841 [Pelagophyceae sp. CCMP2097]|nr:hypothetical protein M885DRAFT_521841 [Pelagophyceae sp. CCMP2097]|mmetsp:Transcript_22502/g.76083  ORF Transcript_22502/g.76083 Transcript_22502/m.76083 type:complete len:81 (+) Transcript_22502:138-380(+)